MIKIKERFVSEIDPLKIYLFGSYARNENKADSDYDFYIIVPDGSRNELDLAADAYYSICKIGRKAPVDIIVGRESDFENRKTIPGIEQEVFKTGVLLYEK